VALSPHPSWLTVQLPIDEASQVGGARRCVAQLAAGVALPAEASARAELVATEMCTNLLRHASQGRLLVRAVPASGTHAAALELAAIDSGPGMASVEACLRDGYSTGGTAGTGLGAIRRLANTFDIVSQPERGSCVFARLSPRDAVRAPAALRVGAVCLPIPGEHECGDGWMWRPEPEGGSLMLVDGLGHGPQAREAAAAAEAAFAAMPIQPPAPTLQALHQRMSGTRGGAVAIAQIDRGTRMLRYAGIGNIGAALFQGEGRRGLPSHNGILGNLAGRIQGFEYAWTDADMLVMHSDGLQSRWTLDGVPGGMHRDPGLVAAALYRDYSRGRDDVTVAVVALR
jgi:anti-sigma regulatory factor (Ser/Thr protein kinase)